VFCYTDEDRCRVREFGVDSRIEVVPNGVDTERFTPEGPESELIDHDGAVVLFVGRLVEGKRPGDAIEAVTQLPDELNTKLVVVGDGPLRAQLESDSDGQSVEFLGHVPYDEMPAIYRAGDVMILPSRNEGLPRTVLEAFASATPVVSSHLEQTAPVVREGGETVPIGNIAEYAKATERVLTDHMRLGKQGRETVVNEFRWERTVKQTTKPLSNL
jgi:glycosyltransferase involved in cell wall biosynthesis